jgi:hypothetical protein
MSAALHVGPAALDGATMTGAWPSRCSPGAIKTRFDW